MIDIRRGRDRGIADHGWLKSVHTFSFADYHDPSQMGFGVLRVINEDRVAPGRGFGTHSHRDMEIISYVLEGALEHRDSLGTGSILHPGDVQRMSAGTGVTHSEFNASKSDPLHFLQIWIEPSVHGVRPSYAEARFDLVARHGSLPVIVSPDQRNGSLGINQDVILYAGAINDGDSVEMPLSQGRRAYVHAVRGSLEVNETRVEAVDGVKLSGESSVRLRHSTQAAVLLFDLP
jgi:hypothetical protein